MNLVLSVLFGDSQTYNLDMTTFDKGNNSHKIDLLVDFAVKEEIFSNFDNKMRQNKNRNPFAVICCKQLS